MKFSRFFLFGLLFIVVAAAAGVFWALRAIPPLEAQIPGSPVSVQIVSPLNGGFYDSPQTISIQVQATSPNNVSSLEVWADGQLIENQAVSQQFPMAAKASFQLDDPTPGVHVLMARAVDMVGYTSQSSVVMVTIQSSLPMTEYLASEGDSLVSIADFLGIPEEEVAAVNPGIEPGSPLTDEQVVQLPAPEPKPPIIPEDKPAGGGGTPQDPGDPPNPVLYKLKDIASLWNPPKPLPAPPLLTGMIENCNQVKLTIYPQSSKEDGYFIYRWSYGESTFGFKNVNVIGLGGASMQPLVFTEPMNGLASFYYVSAFNMQGESGSAPIALMLDENCLAGLGGKQPIEMELLADFETGVPVQRSYCYYSTREGEWQRFPSQDFDFFQPGEVFLEPRMLNFYPPNPVLEMECWGWDGPVLQYLGYGEHVSSPDPYNFTVLGDNFSFDMPTFNIMNSNPDQPENVAVVSSDAILNLGNKQVPPPINLREAEDGFICDQHIDIANGCQLLLDKQLKEEYLLIWDWAEPTCWGPEQNCPWLKIEGTPKFNLYMENNPVPVSGTYETGLVTPLPWGYQCFYVTASVDTVIGEIESAPSNTFCPDQKNPPKVMVLKPTSIITQRKTSLYQCFTPPKDPAAGLSSDEMMVGVYNTACWDQKFQGAVMFDLTQFYNQLGGYSIQKATLRFDKGSTSYQKDSPGYEVASNLKPLCGVKLGFVTGTGEWASWNPSTALEGGYPALTFFEKPVQTLPDFGSSKNEVNVTDFVDYYKWNDWNGGLGFFSDLNLLIDQGLYSNYVTNSICLNKLQNFELEIQYYSLGQ